MSYGQFNNRIIAIERFVKIKDRTTCKERISLLENKYPKVNMRRRKI